MTNLNEVREKYLRAQLAGDRREAVRIVVEEGLDQGASIIDVQEEVIRAAQDEIGRLWQLNVVTIAQEHMASAISHLALCALFQRARIAAPVGKKVLIACVEGEQHDLPARLASDVLEIDGFDVRFLGADVPHDELLNMVRDEHPDLIGLSVTMTLNIPSLRVAVSRLRTVSVVPIFIGGHALKWSPSLEAELQVHAPGASPAQVLGMARKLTGLAS